MNAIDKLQVENNQHRQQVLTEARVIVDDLRRLATAIEAAVNAGDIERIHSTIPATFSRVENVRRAAVSVDTLDNLLARVQKAGPQ